MRNKQTHYQTNRRFLLTVGSITFLGSLLFLVSFRIFSSTLSAASFSSLSFPARAFLSLFSPLLPILLLVGGFQLGIANTKILTSSEGIELHQLGFFTKSPWSNVASVALFQSGNVPAQAIYLHQPAKQFFKLLPFGVVTSIQMIPLSPFKFDANSDFGRALRLYRPDLFN